MKYFFKRIVIYLLVSALVFSLTACTPLTIKKPQMIKNETSQPNNLINAKTGVYANASNKDVYVMFSFNTNNNEIKILKISNEMNDMLDSITISNEYKKNRMNYDSNGSIITDFIQITQSGDYKPAYKYISVTYNDDLSLLTTSSQKMNTYYVVHAIASPIEVPTAIFISIVSLSNGFKHFYTIHPEVDNNKVNYYGTQIDKMLTIKLEQEFVQLKNKTDNLSIDNKLTAITAFLKEYPKYPAALKFQQKTIDDKSENLYKYAINNNSLDALDKYLTEFPKGKYVNEVTALRNKLSEEKDWLSAYQTNSIGSYQGYLDKYYPSGKHVSDANSRLTTLTASSLSSKYSELASSSYVPPGGNNYKVKLMFSAAKGKAPGLIYKIKRAMKVRDPLGFFNPFWVPTFVSEGANADRGVILGNWYTSNYQGWDNWVSHFSQEMGKLSGDGLILYDVTPLGNIGQSNYSSSYSASEPMTSNTNIETGSGKKFKCTFNCDTGDGVYTQYEGDEISIIVTAKDTNDAVWKARQVGNDKCMEINKHSRVFEPLTRKAYYCNEE